MSSSNMSNASAEIAKAIEEAAKGVSSDQSVQMSTERLLKSTLEAVPPTHRIEDTIAVILEEETLSDE